MSAAEPVLSIKGLSKRYADGTEALQSFDLDVPPGQLLVVIGPSGAGKSTLLRCINRLAEPTDGSVVFEGVDIANAGRRNLRRARRRIGMVFQQFNLVETHSAVRNVLHGRLGYTSSLKGALGSFARQDVDRALEILTELGLENEAFKRCADLSGGQKQRVGIGRAIMQGASLILADEPIASLDPWSSKSIMEILKKVAVSEGLTTIVNLHQVGYAKDFGDRIVGIRAGKKFCDVSADGIDESMIDELYHGDLPKSSARES